MIASRPTPTYEHVDKMTAEKGWFRNQLWQIEDILNGRWGYWMAICLNGTVGSGPEWAIPQLDFAAHFEGDKPQCLRVSELSESEEGRRILKTAGGPSDARNHAIRTFERALDYGSNHLGQLVDWWLWAFGVNEITERPRLSERGAIVMYSEFEIHRLIANPADWGAAITSEFLGGAKSSTAWFPTPMCIVHCMTKMTFEADGRDTRLLSVTDPCVGTGAFLLEASNYSLDLSGQDIDPLMCSWTMFAGWLFMPWLVWGNKMMIREFREARNRKKAEALREIVSTPPREPQETSPVAPGLLFDLEATRA